MINRLQSAPQGTPGNMTGEDVALAINALIDLTEGKLTREHLADQFNYKGAITSGDINSISNDGTYTVIKSSVLNFPPLITGNFLLRVTSNGNNYTLQEAINLNDSKQHYARINRPLTASPIYGEWEPVAGAPSKLYKKNIVFIGDSITEAYAIPFYLAQKTGANVSNFGIGGSRLGRHTSNGYKELSGYKIASALASGDWSSVVSGAEYTRDNHGDDNTPQATGLRDTDWSKVDYLVVGYGTNDFGGSNEIGIPSDLGAGNEYYLEVTADAMVQNITKAHPHLKVLYWLPLWRYKTPRDPAGIEGGSDVSKNLCTDRGIDGHFLVDYCSLIASKCEKYKQPYIDLHKTSGITQETKGHYLHDGLHPTTAGAVHLAGKLQGALESTF